MDQDKKGHKSVFGLFDNRTALQTCVDALKSADFRYQDISVLLPTEESSQNFAHEKGTKAPEGATTGGISGIAIGGALGWLAGIGTLAIPGVGPFIAAGPLLAAFAGAGLGGAIGGIAGGLIGMGIPEYEAKRYEAEIKNGGMLLSVHVDDSDWQKKAKDILERNGARDISSTGEVMGKFGKNTSRVDINSNRSV